LHTAAGRNSGILTVSRESTRSLKEIDMSMNGTIKRLVSDKGFGFIAAGDGTEYFFHQSACTGTAFNQLREGQAVTFDVGHGAKGPRGENVRPA
jgi:cold shock protein